MMSLDCAMLINLNRREDRYWFAMGGLSRLEFTAAQIIQFTARDGLDYPDIESVHNAAVADGFPEFSEFTAPTRNYAAWYWTYRCALRHIIETDKTALLLIDDHLPKPGWTFKRLSYLVDWCEFIAEVDSEPFRILQLTHSFYGREQGFDQDPQTGILAKGLTGGIDTATILNADGANLLLEMASQKPYSTAPDSYFSRLRIRKDESEYAYGLWHTLDEICEHAFIFGDSDLPYQESEGLT